MNTRKIHRAYMLSRPVAYLLFFICLGLSSCEKFLDAKPDGSLSTPQTLRDLELMLDLPTLNDAIGTGVLGADEHYFDFAFWQGYQSERTRQGYLWSITDEDYRDWRTTYGSIFRLNTVLDHLPKIDPGTETGRWERIEASALFIRSFHFWHLLQIYAPVFDSSTADHALGIVLRLNADFHVPSARATVKQGYDQIVSDLLKAIPALPLTTAHPTRPTRAAGHALLARVYLSMGAYREAEEQADASLALYDALIDYNTLDSLAPSPFPLFHQETLFYAMQRYVDIREGTARMDTVLTSLYHPDDLRLAIFYKADGIGHWFKGSYDGNNLGEYFGGIGVDEVYLIRAEGRAKTGDLAGARADLDKLLSHRFRTGTYTPVPDLDQEELIQLVRTERRKQLVMRSLRWYDLRRYNREAAGITLKRVLGDQTFTLPPNDLRYTLLIPAEVIIYTGMEQNPR